MRSSRDRRSPCRVPRRGSLSAKDARQPLRRSQERSGETDRWRGGIQDAARKERAPTIGRMSGYAFHPDAFADLDEIWEYIAENNINAADRVLADIHSALTTLAGSPQIGHRRPDLTTRPLRFHVARDECLIAYAPDQKPLWVVAVLHGRRNPRLMAAILRERD